MLISWIVVLVMALVVFGFRFPLFSRSYVKPLTDEQAIKLFLRLKRWRQPDVDMMVANYRRYASDLDYTGPVFWKVKAGYTLKKHAARNRDTWHKLYYVRDWPIVNDEPTKDSIVFWVPRFVRGSTDKDVPQMMKLKAELRLRYDLPGHRGSGFGSAALLSALILAHYKLTGERVPLQCQYAASDTVHQDGFRLNGGGFRESGLIISYWGGYAHANVGFFLLDMEELES